MITGFALVCLNVLDLDEAKEFYVDTLGFELGMDQVLDGHRWLTVHAPGHPETPLMLTVPEAPMVEEPIADQLRGLLARGYLSVGALSTDDCQATYADLKAKGVDVHRGTRGALLRDRRRVPGPLRQPLAADSAQGPRGDPGRHGVAEQPVTPGRQVETVIEVRQVEVAHP